MANLGSTDTPAAAQSLDLPNGYSPAFEEDSGDLVINDSNGNTVFRWDDTNGQFQLAAPLDADGNDVTNIGSLGTEDLDTRTSFASYVFYTDGSEISAIPQQNPEGVSLAEVTGTDLPTVYRDVVVNQIPPQGNAKAAWGKITFRRGEYTGSVSNIPENGLLGPTALHLEGEVTNFNKQGEDSLQVPGQEPPVRLKTNGDGFVNPDVDSKLATNFTVSNLQIHGDGSAAGGNALDASGSNTWDRCYFFNVTFNEFQNPLKSAFSTDAPTVFEDCMWRGFTDIVTYTNRNQLIRCEWFGDDGSPASVEVSGQTQMWGCESRCTGESTNGVIRADGQSQVFFPRVRKVGGTDGDGTGVFIQGNASVLCPYIYDNRNFRDSIALLDNSTVHWPYDDSSPSRASVVYSGGTEPSVWEPRAPNASTVTFVNISPTRGRFNGVIGGGVLGGVDLSTVNGQHEGDEAVADGTATGATAGDSARWDGGNAEWRVFNSDATV